MEFKTHFRVCVNDSMKKEMVELVNLNISGNILEKKSNYAEEDIGNISQREAFRSLIHSKELQEVLIYNQTRELIDYFRNNFGLEEQYIKADGYCLLNAFICGYKFVKKPSNMNEFRKTIKNALLKEIEDNLATYSGHLLEGDNFFKHFKAYLEEANNELWKKDMTDLLPVILTNALGIQITVFKEIEENTLNFKLYRSDLRPLSDKVRVDRGESIPKRDIVYLLIREEREHYWALVPSGRVENFNRIDLGKA